LLQDCGHRIETLGSQKIGEILVITKSADRLHYEQQSILGNLSLLDQKFLTIGLLPVNANYRFASKWAFGGIPPPESTVVHVLAATPPLFHESPHCYQLLSSQLFLRVCLRQCSLNVFVTRF
jgi:hypothetical protein